MSQHSPIIQIGRPFDADGRVICTTCGGPTIKLVVKKVDSLYLGKVFYKCHPRSLGTVQCNIFIWDDDIQRVRERDNVLDPDSPASTAPPTAPGSTAAAPTVPPATPSPTTQPHFSSQPHVASTSRTAPLRAHHSATVTTPQHHLSGDSPSTRLRQISTPQPQPRQLTPAAAAAAARSIPVTPSPTAARHSAAMDLDPGNETEVTEHVTDDEYMSVDRVKRFKIRMPGTFTASTPSSGDTRVVGGATQGRVRDWVRTVSSEDVFTAPTQDIPLPPHTPPRATMSSTASTSTSAATRLHGLGLGAYTVPASPTTSTVRLSDSHPLFGSPMSTGSPSINPSLGLGLGPPSPGQTPLEAIDEMIRQNRLDAERLAWLRRRVRAYEKSEEFKHRNAEKLKAALTEIDALRTQNQTIIAQNAALKEQNEQILAEFSEFKHQLPR
ncbi:hypothetical protein BKA62DRAFT_777328 [Auriculariales sp. MPI-PUGE-AT-0066]|nr:hypothetical protein BKA62DRAFT_777328 [Auriculariales sp. MPI-PUGE-AT-0066]